MVDVLRIRRLNAMIYRVIKAKRDVSCGVDEYFDEVVGQCSLCSDICIPQRGTLNVCATSCLSFYRRMMAHQQQQQQEQQQQQQQQQHQQLPENAGQAASASSVPDLSIVIPVIVSFGVFFLAIVVLSVVCFRRHRSSFCTKSPKDECTETDFRETALESDGNPAEIERLNSDLERGLPGSDRPVYSPSSPEAEEALSSLCSAETNPNQVHHHQHQKQHHLQPTSIMTVI